MKSYRLRSFGCGCEPNDHFSATEVSRREALGAGLGFVAAMTGLLTEAGHTARAEGLAGGAPVVDRLSVRIVTDIYTDRYPPTQQIPGSRSNGSAARKSRTSRRTARSRRSGAWR